MLEASGELFHSFKNTILRVGKRTQWMQVLPLSQMTRVQSLEKERNGSHKLSSDLHRSAKVHTCPYA